MKILETIKWLLNHPPTHMTNFVPEGITCDYCGATDNLIRYNGIFCICHNCQKRAFDIILKDNQKKK